LLEGFTVLKMLAAAWVFFGVYAISQIEDLRAKALVSER
jgi:hypothetical protein